MHNDELTNFIRCLRHNRQVPFDQDLNAVRHLFDSLTVLYPDVVRRYGVTRFTLALVLRSVRAVPVDPQGLQ